MNGAGPAAMVAQGSSDVAELREAPLGGVPTARRRRVGDLQTQRAGQHGRGLEQVPCLCSATVLGKHGRRLCLFPASLVSGAPDLIRCRRVGPGLALDTWSGLRLPACACLCGQRGTGARPTVCPLHGSMGSRTAEMSLLPEPRPRRAQTFLSPPVPRAGRPGHLCTQAGGASSCQPVDGVTLGACSQLRAETEVESAGPSRRFREQSSVGKAGG